MNGLDPLGQESWCAASFGERRAALARALEEELAGIPGLVGVSIEPGPIGREYDLTAVVETDVGKLRTPLWSHARASIFCDPSVHPASREPMGPRHAISEAADRLRRRLTVPYRLESRGLTIVLSPAPGVERSWVAEHSAFRKRTSVTREDRIEAAADHDLRDLLARFYTGPSLRVVGQSGDAFLLPGGSEAEGPLVTLCHGCGRWEEGARTACGHCGAERVEVVIAARPTLTDARIGRG
jgi:hypothetical protein